MNNTTAIRTLAAIVVVVVLIFTAGSLAAAAATSSTPQPQNLICIHPGSDATCSQEGIISTTQIPLPILQPQASVTFTIIKRVINDIVGTISAKYFTSSAGGTNASPQTSFLGAQSRGATSVTLKPGTSSAVLLQQANATTIAVTDHNKCSSSDIITCIHKETYHTAKDTTPFVLPIPFP